MEIYAPLCKVQGFRVEAGGLLSLIFVFRGL